MDFSKKNGNGANDFSSEKKIHIMNHKQKVKYFKRIRSTGDSFFSLQIFSMAIFIDILVKHYSQFTLFTGDSFLKFEDKAFCSKKDLKIRKIQRKRLIRFK